MTAQSLEEQAVSAARFLEGVRSIFSTSPPKKKLAFLSNPNLVVLGYLVESSSGQPQTVLPFARTPGTARILVDDSRCISTPWHHVVSGEATYTANM